MIPILQKPVMEFLLELLKEHGFTEVMVNVSHLEVVGHEPILAQDMRLMGGLRKKMPITAITFFIITY